MNNSIEEQIAKLLRGTERIEYRDAEIYLVDKETMEAVCNLREEADEEVSGRKRVPKNSLGRYIKPINPDTPAFKYTLFTRKTPRIITDPVKVRENLDKQLSIWKNFERKALREYIEREGITGEGLLSLEKDLETKFFEADREFDRLKEHYEEYEVFITNYTTANVYPAIYYSSKEKIVVNAVGKRVLEPLEKVKRFDSHISITVPNVLWYAPEHTGRARSNATIIEKIESGDYLVVGGSIYYKKSK